MGAVCWKCGAKLRKSIQYQKFRMKDGTAEMRPVCKACSVGKLTFSLP